MSDKTDTPLILIAKVGIFIVLIAGGVVGQKWYAQHKKGSKAAMVQSRPVAPKPAMDPRERALRIADNLRKLTYGRDQYLRVHPGRTAAFSDLVGPGRQIVQFQVIDDEKYPETFPPGITIVATMPDGVAKDSEALEVYQRPQIPTPTDAEEKWSSYSPGSIDVLTLLRVVRNHAPGSPSTYALTDHLLTSLRPSSAIAPPTNAVLRELRSFLEDRSIPKHQRDLVLDAIQRAASLETVRFQLQLATHSDSADLRETAIQHLSAPNPSSDTQFYELGWCESSHPPVLAAVARAIVNYPFRETGIELLLNAALDSTHEDPARTAIAREALLGLSGPEAVPQVVARLETQLPLSDGGKFLARVLAPIGDERAGKAVVAWLQKADEDASSFIEHLGPRPKDPQLLAAWAWALEPTVAFAYEGNREAIRTFLAPPQISGSLENGSFEDGTLRGFTAEGSVEVIKRWCRVEATERQYMAFMNTMENPVDGLATLTSEPFVVPEGRKTLLFDFFLAGSAVLRPAVELIEVRLGPEAALVDARLFDDLQLANSNQNISGFDLGTCFRTAGISVEEWAGTGTPVQVRFILKGRGKLPDRIPGTLRFDHSPMGSNQPGTGLFLDNLRLSRRSETSTPAIAMDSVRMSSDEKTATIRFRTGALPPGSTLLITSLQTDLVTRLELDPRGEATFTKDFDEDDRANTFYLAYFVTHAAEEGPFFGPVTNVYIPLDPKEPATVERSY
jgi:hypothetical protein